MTKAEKPPQNKKNANKAVPDMAYRYQRAHEKLFGAESVQVRARILEAKLNPDLRDHVVDDFIKRVLELAEGETEL